MSSYPKDSVSCMHLEAAPEFVVPGGRLLHHSARDSRFPYVYEVETHPLVHDFDAVKRIWVYIQDTSKEALEKQFNFEETLYIPLGPNSSMGKRGLFEMDDGTVVYARALGSKNPNNDVIIAWSYLGRRVSRIPQAIEELERVRDNILGSPEDMTLEKPTANSEGILVGGSHFERLGQDGVKNTRCVSLTMSHQHAKNRVGPTAGSKMYNSELSENEIIRCDTVKISTQLAMESLRLFAPASLLQTLEDNAEANNVPRIGVPENVAYPAVQVNIAPAVSHRDCYGKGLQGMGEFGQVEGHRDGLDSAGALTCMIANSRVPDDYESGRFHLLSLGLYIRLEPTTIMNFCGLNRHGGSPPISPEGENVTDDAYRLMFVCYPPQSMISGAGASIMPLASMPKGVLTLGPEITTHLSFSEQPNVTNEACWTMDGPVLMDRYSHFQLVARAGFQLLSYIFQQLPPDYELLLDSDKFFDACSITIEKPGVQERKGAPNTESLSVGGGDVEEESNAREVPQGSIDTDEEPRVRVTAGKWRYAPDGAIVDSYGDKEQLNAVVRRREQMYNWIDHMEQRAQFVPSLRNIDFGNQRDKIKEGQLGIWAKRLNSKVSRKRTLEAGGISSEPAPKRARKGDCLHDVAESVNAHVAKTRLLPEVSKVLNPSSQGRPLARKTRNKSALEKRIAKERIFDVVIDRSQCPEHIRKAVERRRKDVQSEQTSSFLDDHLENSDTEPESPSEASDDEFVEIESNHRLVTPMEISDLLPQNSTQIKSKSSIPWTGNVNNFLSTLTNEAVEEVIDQFESVLMVSNRSFQSSSFEVTSSICSSVLSQINDQPAELTTATSILDFWTQLKNMDDLTLLSSITTRASCALYMLSSWSTMSWITRTVTGGLEGIYQGTWVGILIADIRRIIQDAHQTKERVGILSPSKYLPGITGAEVYTFKAPRLLLDANGQNKTIQGVATKAIEQWLHFPRKATTVTQNALVDTLLKCGLISILYLDQVWSMFRYPYKHVIYGMQSGRKPNSTDTESALQHFQSRLQVHDLMLPDTEMRSSLLRLEALIRRGKWATAPASQALPRQHLRSIPEDPAHKTPVHTEDAFKTFSDFLNTFQILLKDGTAAHCASGDRYIKKTAQKPDYFLPFRSKAPTFVKALLTIYSDAGRLSTPAGLFNLAAFRGVFYGSEFARNNLQWFNTFKDWDQHYTAQKALEGKDETFFVAKNAYGPHQMHRSVDNLASYWKVAVEKWPTHLKVDNPKRDIFKLFAFFEHNLSYVGDLAALLMVGDLVDCGFVNMPSAVDMGSLVEQINRGAVKGLIQLGLVSPKYTKKDAAQAFALLHQHVEETSSRDNKELMGYNPIMLEHALCKFQRIYRKRDGRKKGKAKVKLM